jgi:hypothetical protein
VPERSNGAVSKTVVPLTGDRGFESLPLRQGAGPTEVPGVRGYVASRPAATVPRRINTKDILGCRRVFESVARFRVRSLTPLYPGRSVTADKAASLLVGFSDLQHDP